MRWVLRAVRDFGRGEGVRGPAAATRGVSCGGFFVWCGISVVARVCVGQRLLHEGCHAVGSLCGAGFRSWRGCAWASGCYTRGVMRWVLCVVRDFGRGEGVRGPAA